jgi:subtilase family serine protease/uncharacterized membrane protein
MRTLRFSPLCVLASALFCVTAATAQYAAPAVRIVNQIDEKQLVTLTGMVHPQANAKNDRGAAPDSTPLNRIHLMLKRSASQQASLDQLMGQLHTPGNPNYHKWLTPDQFGKQFGPSDQDIATVETWLTGHGFNVAGVKPGKQVIEFSGNVGQFRSAFHTQIHQYAVKGETHFSNASDPQIPAALAPVVGGFVSLNNFHAKSQVKAMGKAMYDPSTHTATTDWTWGTTTGGVDFVLSPQDYAVEYDLPAASTGTDGSGQTIAIINDSNVNIDLVNQFRSLFSLPVNPPQVIIDGNDPGVNGDAVEAYLDVEWAGAVAPNATIDLVIGADTELQSGLYMAAEHAVYGNLAPVMSISFGYCEQGLGSYNSFWNNLWEEAAAQGTTVMVSSGDAGSAGCDDDNTQYYAVNGQAVNGFGSTPYNVAVGGTDFYYSFWNSSSVTLSSFSPYWTTTPQATPLPSLKGYLTEQPWNDSQFGDDLSQTYAYSSGASTSIAAGSGGASNCATGSGLGSGQYSSCTAGYPKPSWQVATGMPADNVRDLPDVSLFASNGSNYSFYPICQDDGDCQPASSGNVIQIYGVGGTSASTPAFAGMMALVNQKYGPQGQANYVLYPLAKQFPAAFHDVTVGSNTVPCDFSDGTPDCIAAPSPYNYSIDDPTYGTATEGEIGTGTTPEYNAAVGYDLASGLGTIDVNQMLANWNSVKFDATTTTLTVSPTSFAHGTAPTISGTVTGTGTPAGQVALLTNSADAAHQSQTYFTLSSGSYSSNTVSYLPGGTYDVWTQYGGDGTNGLSSSTPVQITVTPENSELSLSVYENGSTTAANTSVTYGTPLTLDAQPCPSNCPASYTVPTGTVTFSDNSNAINTAVVDSAGTAEYTSPNTFNAGSHSITAMYSGDGSYNASTSAAFPFTVTQATPTVYIINSFGAPYNAGQTTTLSIAVESLAYGLAPSGKVNLTGMPAGAPISATLVAGVDPYYGTTVGQATITIPASAAAGTYNITATYAPDTASAVNYTTASGTVQVVITGASGVNTTTSATASSPNTSPNAVVTVTGMVTAASGSAPTGSIYFLFAAIYMNVFQDIYFTSQEATLVPGSGSSSTYSMTFDSGTLPQGVNQITAQYIGSSTDNPSTAVVTIGDTYADFALTANTTILPVLPGGNAATNVNVASMNTFTGGVNLTCTVPSGWSCTTPNSATVANGGSATVALSVTAPSNASKGSYDVLITGTDAATGEYVHTLGLRAQVASSVPGFTLANGGSVTVSPGATTGNTSTISVTPSNGFTGTVNLTCAVTTTPASPTSPATCSVPSSVTVSGTTAVPATLTVGTTSTTTPGAYVVTVTGKNGSMSSSTTVGVTVNLPPSIALTNGAAISFQAGATAGDTSTITVTPAGGFTGNVALTCVVTPTAAVSPATCAAAPTPVDITGTAAGISTVTVTTTATTTPGTYTATVTGTSGSVTGNTAVSVTVTAPPTPAIALTNNGPISFVAGATSGDTATITVTPLNAFTGVVALTCTVTTTPASPTSPATCNVSPSVDITGTGALTGTLTITTTSTTTTGSYGVTVTGKDAATGKVSSSTTVSVMVNAPASFALSNSGGISLQAGATAGNTVVVTVTPAGGYTGTVAFTCAITPTASSSPGTCAVPSATVTGTAAVNATLTITTTYATTPGTYTATVTGTDTVTGTITSKTTVGVTVTAPPPPAIALTNSGALSFIAGATTGDSGTITVTPSYGFTGVVNLTCAVTPVATSSPATCSVGPTVTITGTGAMTSTVTVTTTGTTTPGTYTATVTGKDGSVTGSTAVSVTVLAVPSFTLSNNGPITFGVGATSGNTATITVASVNSFTSTVGLACAVTSTPPSGTSIPTCSLASQTVAGGSGTDVLTIGTTSTTTTGNYSVTVTGTSGTLTPQTTVVNITVTGSYTVAAGAVTPASVSPGGTATSTITVSSTNGYAGSISVSCSVASLAGGIDTPTCTATQPSGSLSSTTTSVTSTVTVRTTGATSGELVRPKMGPGKGWMGAGSGAILALLLFFGIPARRRGWQSMLGMVVLMVVLGAMAGCGGGGGGGGGGNSGTTAGSYTITVTATGNPAQSSGNTTTFTVTVN